jgi:hypothetical protein
LKGGREEKNDGVFEKFIEGERKEWLDKVRSCYLDLK